MTTPPAAPFIVGVGRSGTTLLRMMLDARDDLAIPYETHFIATLLSYPVEQLSLPDFLRHLTTAPTWPNLAVRAEDLREALLQLQPFNVPDGLRTFYRLYARRHGKHLWGDKTPPYRNFMAGIEQLLPEARFIHIIRDGRDVALSFAGLWFGPPNDLVSQATFWKQEVLAARAQASALRHYLEVRFESLVQDPEATLRQVCDFLGLAFQPQMLTYGRTATERLSEIKQAIGPSGAISMDLGEFTSVYARTMSEPDRSRISRWHTEMTRPHVRVFEAVAGDLLEELGYEITR